MKREFKIGDKFRVKENGLIGTITDTITDYFIIGSLLQGVDPTEYYSVLWDGARGLTGTYDAKICHNMYELIHEQDEFPSQYFITHKSIQEFGKIPYAGKVQIHQYHQTDESTFDDTCQHESVPYQGLIETYNYCKKCNEKLP